MSCAPSRVSNAQVSAAATTHRPSLQWPLRITSPLGIAGELQRADVLFDRVQGADLLERLLHVLRWTELGARHVGIVQSLIARARRLHHTQRAAGGRECRKRRAGAQEIERLCALHGAEREAALEKLKAASGMDLYCPLD